MSVAGGGIRVCLDVIGRDANGIETGRWHNPDDLITAQWAQLVTTNILFQGSTLTTAVYDTGGTQRTVGSPGGATITALTITAGIGAPAAAYVSDYVLSTVVANAASSTIAATLGTFTETGAVTSGSFTITGTITNGSGSTINYTELGLYCTVKDNGGTNRTVMLTHDVFSAVPVSNTGTLAITYTITNS